MKRPLYTLSAAAALLALAPALALASGEDAARQAPTASCVCASHRALAAEAVRAQPGDREAERLREIWSVP